MTRLVETWQFFQSDEIPANSSLFQIFKVDANIRPMVTTQIIIDEVGAISGGDIVAINRFSTDLKIKVLNGAVMFIGSFPNDVENGLIDLGKFDILFEETEFTLFNHPSSANQPHPYKDMVYYVHFKRNGELSMFSQSI